MLLGNAQEVEMHYPFIGMYHLTKTRTYSWLVHFYEHFVFVCECRINEMQNVFIEFIFVFLMVHVT